MKKLYHAAATGNWETADNTLGSGEERLEILKSPVLSVTNETALHIVAGAKQVKFVEMLLEEQGINPLMDKKDCKGNTALCTAAAAGASKIVSKLLRMRPELLSIKGGGNMTPAYVAATFGHGALASELYKCMESRDPMKDDDKIYLFFACINNNLFGKCLHKQLTNFFFSLCMHHYIPKYKSSNRNNNIPFIYLFIYLFL